MNDLERLYRAHIDRARRLAFLLLGDLADAEDVAHDAFLRCASRARNLRDRDRFGSYLNRAVVRGVIDQHRSETRRAARELRYTDEVSTSGTSSLVQQHVATRLDVMSALDGLPPPQRAVVIMRYWLDYSEPQIAASLRCSVGTVKSRLSRALDTLKVVIDG